MVKGISRQVIVVHSPEEKMFDQAIFILKDEAVGKEGITNEMLMKEAEKLLRSSESGKRKRNPLLFGSVWACGGALLTGLIWLITAFV